MHGKGRMHGSGNVTEGLGQLSATEKMIAKAKKKQQRAGRVRAFFRKIRLI